MWCQACGKVGREDVSHFWNDRLSHRGMGFSVDLFIFTPALFFSFHPHFISASLFSASLPGKCNKVLCLSTQRAIWGTLNLMLGYWDRRNNEVSQPRNLNWELMLLKRVNEHYCTWSFIDRSLVPISKMGGWIALIAWNPIVNEFTKSHHVDYQHIGNSTEGRDSKHHWVKRSWSLWWSDGAFKK